MKARACDSKPASPKKDVDETWSTYANCLIKAFADISINNGFSPEEISALYCQQRLRKLDEQILDSLVYNVPPAFAGQHELLSEIIDEDATSLMSWAASADSPFLLLGHVGIGKTTYLENYFLNTVLRNDQTVAGLIVDFKTAPTETDPFVKHMLSEVNRHIADLDASLANPDRQTLEALFDEEIQRLRNVISPGNIEAETDHLLAQYINPEEFDNLEPFVRLIGKKISYLKRKKKKKIWIILDNIDQHLFVLHYNAFVTAVSFASRWKVNLIISMRYLSLDTPAAKAVYDSYRPRRLKLSLPDVTAVILKRLDYFVQISTAIRQKCAGSA